MEIQWSILREWASVGLGTPPPHVMEIPAIP